MQQVRLIVKLINVLCFNTLPNLPIFGVGGVIYKLTNNDEGGHQQQLNYLKSKTLKNIYAATVGAMIMSLIPHVAKIIFSHIHYKKNTNYNNKNIYIATANMEKYRKGYGIFQMQRIYQNSRPLKWQGTRLMEECFPYFRGLSIILKIITPPPPPLFVF